jgi:hypothetical protein
VQIEVLTVPECPHRDEAMTRVGHALAVIGRGDVVVVERVITDLDEATSAGMRGSPTILIDGHDPFAMAAEQPSFSCRLLPTDSGLDGAPSIDDLVAALS